MKNNISVDRERLCAPLRDLRNLPAQMLSMFGRFTLTVEDQELAMCSSMLSIFVPAEGTWKQSISVSVPEMVAAVGTIAQIPKINLAIEDGTLLVGGVELSYEVEE